jgi:glycosyltransferase involved in cell wall biosynthesis
VIQVGSKSMDLEASHPAAIAPSSVPKLLVILPYPPNPLRPRTCSMLNDLATFGEIDLVYLDHGERSQIPPDINIRHVTVISNGLASRLFRLAAGCLRGKPFTYQYYNSFSLIRHLRSLDLSAYSAIYVERIPLHELPINHPCVIFDAVDCYTQQVQQCASHWPGLRRFLYKWDSLVIAKYEADVCNRATKLICTAQREAEGFRSIGVLKPILVLVHASNALEFEKRTLREEGKKVLSFHGKLTYVANRLALKRISQLIVPNLDANEYQVRVAGTGSERLIAEHPRLKFYGFVDDIIAHLGSADLSIFPIEISAGLSNKVLESLAAGVPAVITPQVSAGLPETDNLLERGIFVREVSEFSEAIQEYFRIPLSDRQEFRRECIDYVRNLQRPEPRRALLRDYIFPAAITR